MNLLPCGESAILLEFPSLDAVQSMHRRLDAAALPGILDVVPAACTILLTIDLDCWTLAEFVATVKALPVHSFCDSDPSDTQEVKVPITYDGDDLQTVADLMEMSTAELIISHAAQSWQVAFTGFAPGFAYMAAPRWSPEIPRLPEARATVEAGSVALAGAFCGVYPRKSPGGWRIIGHTRLQLWDLDRTTPALLAPGTTVRFVQCS
jgi:KipI family sensor histidine kinase inhibitor